jgi:Polyketide cyclase / dehydrase and lipid transport
MFYEFITVWNFDAPIESVWEEIYASERWPEWWKGVIGMAELKPGDKDGIGSIRRSTWKSVLPYKLEFDLEVTRIEHLKLMEARAFGELEGIGSWRLTSEGETRTRVQYDWRVKTTKPWMNFLAPVARPFFQWNHDIIMGWGEDGLKKRLLSKI